MVEVSIDELNKVMNVVKSGGGQIYEQDGYINFVGVRNYVPDDTFNDTFYIYWKEGGQFKGIKTNEFTTKPGRKTIQNTNGKTNAKGVAILAEGWHPNLWHIGLHKNTYKALRQLSKTTIYRDKTQFGQNSKTYELRLDKNTLETGVFGINLHKTGDPRANGLNGWSEGCQTFKNIADFYDMMELAEAANAKGQKSFSYFLTNTSALGGDQVVNSAGTPYVSSNTYNYGGGGNAQVGNYGAGGGVPGFSDPNVLTPNSKNGFSTTYNSFGKDVIFGTVFPIDDNNRYIDMSSEDISVIQYSEPTLKVDDLKISDKNCAEIGAEPDKISFYVPVVFLNDLMIPQTNITNFSLDYSSFVPQVMVEFVDMKNEILSTNIPKPGTYIKVYIGGNGDEKYYKPIRQDFVITNINKTNKTGGEYQNYPNSGNPIKYRLTGILNVPLGFRKMPWSSSKINARQAMFNISNTVGLGFATNFATNSNTDVMRWVNSQNKSYYDFMRDITQHSCYSPYTFFASFIDQYYVLNYIECRRLLSHGGDKKDLPQMIYNCILPDLSKNEKPKTDDLNKSDQKVSYYFLTNSLEFKGWTNYIEEYYEINEGQSFVSDGYNKILTYSDKCGFQSLPSKNYKFLLMPIDNLKRDGEKNIVSLPESVSYDSYIPLNLRQTTDFGYSETEKVYDNPTAAESRIDIGEVDTSNVFPLYFYASVQNDFQMKSLRKCGISVRLQNYNPSITRFSRIWVDIYDMNKNSLFKIRKNENIDDIKNDDIKKQFINKNENIIAFKEDIANDNEQQIYNRSLSGWYVVTEMKIIYNTVKDFKGVTYKKLQTQLTLNRVDYKPTFKFEYENAKKAIEKYKSENVADNIMCGGDIM